MIDRDAVAIATEVIVLEGSYLDRKQWKEWLQLYSEDVVYWVPAWRSEYEETDDPNTQVSVIYHDSRVGLEERVTRIESRKSVTAMPLPRTVHYVSNVIGSIKDQETIEAQMNWMVQIYDPRTANEHRNFGWSEVQIKNCGERWKISQKTIHLQNDRLPPVMDFYLL